MEIVGWHPASITETYEGWVNFEQLPHFMRALERAQGSPTGAEWTLRSPKGEVPWEGMTMENVRAERITWRSTGSSPQQHSGAVTFQHVSRNCTKVTVTIEFEQDQAVEAGASTDAIRTLHKRLDSTLNLLAMFGVGSRAAVAFTPGLL